MLVNRAICYLEPVMKETCRDTTKKYWQTFRDAL